MYDVLIWPLTYFGLGYIFSLSLIGFITIVNGIRTNKNYSGVTKLIYEIFNITSLALYLLGLLTVMPLLIENTPKNNISNANGLMFVLAIVITLVLAYKHSIKAHHSD